MATIIFDPYSVESVITTAVLLNIRGDRFKGAVPFNTEKVPAGEHTYFTVLTTLSSDRLRDFQQGTEKAQIIDVHEVIDLYDGIDDGLEPSLLRSVFLTEYNAPLYKLVLAMDRFKGRNSHLFKMQEEELPSDYIKSSLSSHSLVYATFKNALRSLYVKTQFKFTDANREGYEEFFESIKGQINSYLRISNVEMSGVRYRIPMMNTNIQEAAWIKHYLERIFDIGILYEVSGTNIVAISWSKIEGVEKKFENLLKLHISKDYTIIFAGQS